MAQKRSQVRRESTNLRMVFSGFTNSQSTASVLSRPASPPQSTQRCRFAASPQFALDSVRVLATCAPSQPRDDADVDAFDVITHRLLGDNGEDSALATG